MRRTVFSDSVAVAICVLGLFVAILSRKALGAEWSRDVELKQGHRIFGELLSISPHVVRQ
jgi:hypothetical protein